MGAPVEDCIHVHLIQAMAPIATQVAIWNFLGVLDIDLGHCSGYLEYVGMITRNFVQFHMDYVEVTVVHF